MTMCCRPAYQAGWLHGLSRPRRAASRCKTFPQKSGNSAPWCSSIFHYLADFGRPWKHPKVLTRQTRSKNQSCPTISMHQSGDANLFDDGLHEGGAEELAVVFRSTRALTRQENDVLTPLPRAQAESCPLSMVVEFPFRPPTHLSAALASKSRWFQTYICLSTSCRFRRRRPTFSFSPVILRARRAP